MKINTATISLTNRCNFNCKHCSIDAGEKLENELTTKETFKILDELKLLGVKKIEFTGGEPLLVNNLDKLILYAKKLDFKVKLLTNGLLLSEEKIRIFEKLGLDAIAISLDGADYKTFRKIRPITEKCFNKLLQNIKLASLSNIFLKINTVAAKSNLNNIQKIIDFCNQNKIEELRICYFTKVGRGTDLDEQINPEMWAEHIKKFKSEFTEVFVGFSHSKFKSVCMMEEEIPLYISNTGNIHLCPLKEAVGNIRKDPIKKIINTKITPCLSNKKNYKKLKPICPLKKYKLEKIS